MTTLRDTYTRAYGGTTRLPAGIVVIREWSTETFTADCECGWTSRRRKITAENRFKLSTDAAKHRDSGRCKRGR